LSVSTACGSFSIAITVLKAAPSFTLEKPSPSPPGPEKISTTGLGPVFIKWVLNDENLRDKKCVAKSRTN
jgi:hypothetical protein